MIGITTCDCIGQRPTIGSPHHLASLADSPQRGECSEKRTVGPVAQPTLEVWVIPSRELRAAPKEPPYIPKKFPNNFFPSVVMMLSGWNWTPTTGNEVCRTP